MDGPEFESQSEAVFSSLKRRYRLSGSSSLSFNEYRGSCQGLKRPEPDIEYLSPSSTEFETERSYTSAPRLHLPSIYGKSLPVPEEFAYKVFLMQNMKYYQRFQGRPNVGHHSHMFYAVASYRPCWSSCLQIGHTTGFIYVYVPLWCNSP